MSLRAKHSQPNVVSLLLLPLAITGSICLWCDRAGYRGDNREAGTEFRHQTQAKTIQVD